MHVKYKGGKPRGVASRTRGLQWIRENAREGVLYFADDDNTYDLELFREVSYHIFCLFVKSVPYRVFIVRNNSNEFTKLIHLFEGTLWLGRLR